MTCTKADAYAMDVVTTETRTQRYDYRDLLAQRDQIQQARDRELKAIDELIADADALGLRPRPLPDPALPDSRLPQERF